MLSEMMKKTQQRRMYNGRKPRVAIRRLWEEEKEDIIFEDKLICLKRGTPMTAILTTHSLLLNSTHLKLEDILSVSCVFDCFRLTIHTYVTFETRWVPALFGLPRQRYFCLNFMAQNGEKLAEWKNALEKQGCYINSVPVFFGIKGSTSGTVDSVSDTGIALKPRKSFLVIINPCSGRGHARKIYYDEVEPIFKLAGFSCKVVETNGPRHAQALVSSFNFHACPDGIICVGGDGIVNEVLNGLHSREDEKSCGIAIGIVPAGSDNSLVWTVFGISDPVTAALAIIKGHLVQTDVVAIKGMEDSAMYLGHTTFYLGFMSDVLELSAKYRRFGPLRYLVAGLIRLFNLRYYECEVKYIPAVEKGSYFDSDSALCEMTKDSTSKAIIEGCGIDKQGNWKSSKGLFLGIIICNHQCKTVQCLKTQNLAPSAKHNDGLLDLLLVHKIGLFRLLWFLILMQYSRHVSLPFVEYIKVCRARIKYVEGSISCGVDGELLTIDTPAFISVSPRQIYLIGHRVD